MIGLLVELAISWLALWFVCKKNINVLGLGPTKNRLRHFVIGFIIAAIPCIIYHLLSVAFINNRWLLQNTYTTLAFVSAFWWVLTSILFEELLFRGALLYILIKKLNENKACILSAIAFGAFHIITFNVGGNPLQSLIVFCMTGFMGIALAKAFAKTGSIYLPAALHLGWNFVNIIIFSNGPLGQQLFIKANTGKLAGPESLFIFLFQVFALPCITLLYVRYAVKNNGVHRASVQ